MINKIFKVTVSLLKETASVAKDLFKILIPAIIIVKILQEIGAIDLLSKALEPVMHLFGLPGEMAIVWTTAIVTNIYGGIAVLMMFINETPLSVAQMTTLTTMMLICHALPVELALTHKVGGKYLFLGTLRFLGACFSGIILYQFYKFFELFSEQAVIRWAEQKAEATLIDWGINQFSNLVYIIIVLFCLLAMMKFLNYIKFTDLLGKILKPLLIVMGISSKGASIAVFGLLAGITFGSGLLLAEVKNKAVDPKDIVLVLAFLSLCHGIIEDTALMMLIGGDISGILFFRLIFAVLVLAILSRIKFIDIRKFSSNRHCPEGNRKEVVE